MKDLREEISRILGDMPEHNTTPEHDYVLDQIMEAIECR